MRVFKSKYSGRNSSSSSALHLSVQNDCAPYALEMVKEAFINGYSSSNFLKCFCRGLPVCTCYSISSLIIVIMAR
eukprot:33420-Pelagomonas_calceolata.AAC.4